MAIDSEWMGRIEKHTAGSLYESVRRLSADMETGIGDLAGRADGLARDVASVREELRALAAEVAELGSRIEGAIASSERSAASVQESVEHALSNRQGSAQLAEELVKVLERARTQQRFDEP